MNIKDIRCFEFEISSLCNARCPLCSRTQILDNPSIPNFENSYISIADIRSVFDSIDTSDKGLCFNGNVGDPMTNPDFIDIMDYFHNKSEKLKVEIRTNGGLRDTDFWHSMGKLSKQISSKKGKCQVVFAIDGLEDTNHIYRVGVNYKKVIENLKTYIAAGGDAAWAFIVFDHNYHQETEIRELAKSLGVSSFIKVKSLRNVFKSIDNMSQSNTYTFSNDIIEDKRKIIQTLKSNEPLPARDYSANITCMHNHYNRVYIMGGMTVWPCCPLYDAWQRKTPSFMKTLEDYDNDWNSLHKHSLEEILNSSFFKELSKRWVTTNSIFTAECIRQCSNNGKFNTIREEAYIR